MQYIINLNYKLQTSHTNLTLKLYKLYLHCYLLQGRDFLETPYLAFNLIRLQVWSHSVPNEGHFT
jgi:hypothetical protein